MRNLSHKCPDCGGDGKETCHSPDHGFYSMIGWHYDACNGGRGCPVCGWNDDHKVKGGSKCESCNGIGRVTKEECVEIMDNFGIDEYIDCMESDSGVTILLP